MNAAIHASRSQALWRDAYDAVASAMPGFAADARPMLTGFAACVDKRIGLHAIAPALGREQGGQEFFAELMTRAKAGRGGEVLIDWPAGPQFLDRFAKPYGTAIGGTSAQAACPSPVSARRSSWRFRTAARGNWRRCTVTSN
ncbi:MAG: hypothetical protein ABSF67_23550 [Roseiarcus sp.]|jgi:ADP-dependent phosphofructokinase/glucokinase